MYPELVESLQGMKRGKCVDEAGIIVEMLKDASRLFLLAVLDLFNNVLAFDLAPLGPWKRTKLVVIFKKGDPPDVANYRPISTRPIL